ncbi:MAG: uncharacterized protein JWP97_552 [Labilithrix sp.]|nr:uncharacterized protein [Labilithrix sp.]
MRPLRLAAGLLATLVAACSLLVEASPAQCKVDADCYTRGGEFAEAVCLHDRCIAPDGGGVDAGLCTTNKECTAKLGAPSLCRSTDHVCVRLLSPECQTLDGDTQDDDAIIFGALNSISGPNGTSGVARQNAGDLALGEIKVSVGGIRASAGGKSRPLAFVQCDDAADSLTPARHLVEDLRLPAIVGVASSSRVIDVATKVTIPNGVLLITPVATSPAITSLADNGLLWRTSPSDVVQAIALNDQLVALEAKYRVDNAVPAATKIRIAIVYINESYGLGLYEAVTRDGKINGKPIGDPSNSGLVTALSYPPSPTDLAAQVSNLLDQPLRPNIVVAFGSAEIITKLVPPLEAGWGSGAPRPLYLFSDAVQKTELLDLVSSNNALRKRIRGTVPAAPRSSSTFQSFIGKYEGTYGGPAPSVFGMAGTYDSVFLLGYLVGAAGERPITGAELAKGFARLVSGAKIEAGGTKMNAGLAALTAPGSVDFEGASGPLDFDLMTGEAPSNVDVWCIDAPAPGKPAFMPSGRLYDATAGAVTGTFNVPACHAGAAD